MRTILVVMVVGICGIAEVSARDIHVNNLIGDNRSTGTSAQLSSPRVGPVRTIQRALSLADFGDRVVIANTGVPYRERISVEGPRNSGSEVFPFVIEGSGATLDGTADISPELWKPGGKDVIRFQPPRISFQQLFLQGKPLPQQSLDRRSQLASLEPGSWTMLNQAIYYRPKPDIDLFDHDLAVSVRRAGVTLYNVRHVVVRNLFVQGFQYDGINAHDNAFECELETLTCRWNGRSGISVGGASRVKIIDCLLESNGVTQLRTEGWSHVVVQNTQMDGEKPWVMDGGSLTIDGEVKQRKHEQVGVDSAPLNRP